MTNKFDWPDAAIAQLRQLWAEGLPTLKIGERMRMSKNSVIGKAHRLKLPPRQNPVKLDPTKPRAPRAARPKPALIIAAKPVIVAPPPPPPRAFIAGAGSCQYPLWSNASLPPRPAKFCNGPTVRRADGHAYSYCARHVFICYNNTSQARA